MKEINPPINNKKSTLLRIRGIIPPMNNGINHSMNERNQPCNEWKESAIQWMKRINPPMNEWIQPSNEWRELTIQWMEKSTFQSMKKINPLINEKN